jgi:hypothetical protein
MNEPDEADDRDGRDDNEKRPETDDIIYGSLALNLDIGAVLCYL